MIDEIYRVLKNDGKVLVVVRGIEDYTYDKTKEIVERGIIHIEESDKTKSVHSEDSMITYFFEKGIRKIILQIMEEDYERNNKSKVLENVTSR